MRMRSQERLRLQDVASQGDREREREREIEREKEREREREPHLPDEREREPLLLGGDNKATKEVIGYRTKSSLEGVCRKSPPPADASTTCATFCIISVQQAMTCTTR